MESRLLVSLVTKASIITTVAVTSLVICSLYYFQVPVSVEIPYTIPVGTPFTYESEFSQGELGVLNTSYWVVDPQLISGTHYIEGGMLKIVSNSRYQVGFGMKWKSPSYLNNDWEPWLPLYWKYHCEVTFVKPESTTEIPRLIVENWIAWEAGKSFTAMVWYEHGSLMYSYGAFPRDYGYGVLLDRFSLPNEFDVTIDTDYRARSMKIEWSNHRYNVPLQVERIGSIPKPFTHFQITLMEPGTIYVKNLRVVLF